MDATPPLRARLAVAGLALAGLASLGVLAAAAVPGARADTGLPLPGGVTLPPVSIPAPPVSIPVPPVSIPTLPLPGATTGTTTTAPSDPAPPSTADPTTRGQASAAADAATDLAGAIRLAGGRISVPAASVVAPIRLVMSRVRVLPAQVSKGGQKLLATFRLSDSRGYLVRGARVDVRSVPPGRVRPASALSRTDGTVRLPLQTTRLLALRRGVLTVLVAGYAPTQAPSARAETKSLVRVPVRPARRP